MPLALLSVFADEEALPQIINLLEDPDANVRSTAAEVFAILFEKRELTDNLPFVLAKCLCRCIVRCDQRCCTADH